MAAKILLLTLSAIFSGCGIKTPDAKGELAQAPTSSNIGAANKENLEPAPEPLALAGAPSLILESQR